MERGLLAAARAEVGAPELVLVGRGLTAPAVVEVGVVGVVVLAGLLDEVLVLCTLGGMTEERRAAPAAGVPPLEVEGVDMVADKTMDDGRISKDETCRGSRYACRYYQSVDCRGMVPLT